MQKIISENAAKIKTLNDEVEQLKEKLKRDSKSHSRVTFLDSLRLVSNHLRGKIASQTQTTSEIFKGNCMSKFTINDVLNAVGPHIWNLMFIMMSSKEDYKDMTKSPINWDTHYTGFYDKSSFHKHTKFIRLLYNVFHQMFTASDGVCKFPFHILLGDSIQANGGSKNLTEVLNRLDIISSLTTNKSYMDSVASDKILKKLANDFVADTWPIVSLDNIDFDQPNAHFNNQKRGLHATSMQALYRDMSIKLHPDEIIDENDQNYSLPYDVDEMFHSFSENDVLMFNSDEIPATGNTHNNVFA